MNKIIKEGLSGILIVYMFFNIPTLFIGLIESHSEACKKYPTTRIALLFPVMKLGCWLGEPLNKEEK